MKISAIIQARMGSSRLPGKVLMKMGEKSLLEHVVNRLKNVKILISIVIATTDKKEDKRIVEFAARNNINYYRGSEADVLDRFVKAGEQERADVIVRVCADNPFIDPFYTTELIQFFLEKKPDYAGYRLSNGTPSIVTGIGLFPEVVSLDALKKAHELSFEPQHFEHVTHFIYTHPESFEIRYLKVDADIEEVKLCLTVDTPLDFEIANKIYNSLCKGDKIITKNEILNFVKNNSNIRRTMSNLFEVNRKKRLMNLNKKGSQNEKSD